MAMRVEGLWRYPVKSFQGVAEGSLRVGEGGIEGDRRWGFLSEDGSKVLSAKRYRRLLEGETDGEELWWPGSGRYRLPGPGDTAADVDAAAAEWLGTEVRLRAAVVDLSVGYEMTFDPPNDDAEYFVIPAPRGSFVDLAPLHLMVRQTLEWCAAQRVDLNWDVRRFRPNVLVDAPDHEPFAEDGWVGRRIAVGTAVLEVMQPTVRCAMPLRAQSGLDRQAGMYQALEELHANHLGLYVGVVEPGEIAMGDDATLL